MGMTLSQLKREMPYRELRARMLLDRRRHREAEVAAERAKFMRQHAGRGRR